MCELEADHTCASNYQYNSTTKMCSAIPICNVGAFDPNTSKCFEAQNTCPYGPQYTCKPYLGKNMCSQYDCIQVAGNETNTDTATGVDDKTNDDALIDPNGSCLGNIYFYNGKDSRCRSWGVSLVGSGCCNHKTYLMGTMDCDPDEKQLSMQRSQKLCHYVGEYDSKHIDLGFSEIATEKKKTYCCFNSILARIIHEQGRPQLIKFSTEGWGTPKNPNCRGFTPEEFQMIDFNKINMDEWTGQIATKNNEAINTDVQNSINEFYNH
jgi:conjugal transfer mating pair stabilization protein TraN